MDISSIASLSTALSQTNAGDQVATAVLRKAMDIQAESAAQLLQSVPPMPGNPPNLGNTVDVKA